MKFRVITLLGVLSLTISGANRAPAQEIIHSVHALPAVNGLPGATAADIEKSKTYDPAAPTPGLPAAADNMVKAGLYKSLDSFVQGDRFEYWQDDINGQFLVMLPSREKEGPARVRLTLQKIDGTAATTIKETIGEKTLTNRFSFLISMPALKAGKYSVKAAYLDDAGKVIGQEAEAVFTKSDKKTASVPFPADGIPIAVEKQKFFPEAAWPVRLGVPLPINTVTDAAHLALYENGQQIPAQIKPIATWCPEGSVQWVHLDFIAHYANGQPATYRLKLLPQAAPEVPSPLKVTQDDNLITVDTGAVKFEVNRKKFTGIQAAWYDPTGKGEYEEDHPEIQNSTGPYIVDGRLIRFDASNDKNVQVKVEDSGPSRVVISATGWYTSSEGRVPPLCQFVTRITATAGQSIIKVSHRTIITYDTHSGRLADAGFQIASPSAERYRLGADGEVKDGKLPATGTMFLHQDRYDHFRLVGATDKPTEGKISDGWFSLAGAAADSYQTTAVVHDIWQKFPKEVELQRGAMTLHFWPAHGQRSFKAEDEIKYENIYKFWSFHEGSMLNLELQPDYYDAFAGPFAGDTFECRPEHALNGEGQGLAIGNDFDVVLSNPGQEADIPKIAKMCQDNPTAAATPEWNASTLALGLIAPIDRGKFSGMEEAVEKGWLSFAKSVQRGNEYGMWIYPDVHTYWDAENDHAQIHRVWHNSHYHEASSVWLMYYRTGSADMLRWARASADHYMNVTTINYAEMDEKGNPKYKFHWPGAMYHCKGLTPWGGETWGMVRRDSHAGPAGHWVDPDVMLWDWYLTGDERAQDLYNMWGKTYSESPFYYGVRREANTTMAIMLNYYRASWDARMLPAIRGLGYSLRTAEPLEDQNPGPLWHPLWINRYYEQMRDPDYVPFILHYARDPHLGDTWTTALGALAYEISGDKTYLAEHYEDIAEFPRHFFRKPNDIYDWYGVGPGPIGDHWGAYMCWGHILYALRQANITDITPPHDTRFSYIVGGDPSLTVYALKSKDQPFKLTFSATSLGGDLHRQDCIFVAPSGKQVAEFKVPPKGGPSSWTEKRDIPADGETGLYKFELRTYESSVKAPLTNLPIEGMIIPKDKPLRMVGAEGYLRPTDPTGTITLTIASGGPSAWAEPCNAVILDGDGKVIAQASMFAPRKTDPLVVTLDPQKNKLPWKLDILGPASMRWTGNSPKLLWGPSDEANRAIQAVLPK